MVYEVLGVYHAETLQVLHSFHPLCFQRVQSFQRDCLAAFLQRQMVKPLYHLYVALFSRSILLLEVVEEVAHAQSVAAHLVGVGRTDALARGAYLRLAFRRLVGFVKQTVGRQDEMRLA